LNERGISGDAAKRIVAGFHAPSRIFAEKVHGDAIGDLLHRFDVSRLEIGAVRFEPHLADTIRGSRFGRFDIDPLIINKMTGEIEVVDELDESQVLYFCASGAGEFLGALLNAAGFFVRCPVEAGLWDNQVEILSQSRKCASLAGGHKYIRFYYVLLGYFGPLNPAE